MKYPEINISGRKIGFKHKPLIIVELGINHVGKISLAKKIIDCAKKCGAEIIKNQTHLPYYEMSEEAKKIKPPNANKSIYDVIKESSLNKKEELKIFKYLKKKNLIFISTPFCREAANYLYELNVPAFKIGSGECNNFPLIEHICKFKKPIILSTGMNNIETIKKSVKIIRKYKIPYALLHCTNLYPTKSSQVRLNCIDEMKNSFPDAVLGLSDHTPNNFSAFAALGKGVSIIEKHFIDDKKIRFGPDIKASIDKNQLKELIDGSKEIFYTRKGNKEILKEEKNVAKFAFASVVSTKFIKKGEKLSKDNLWVKRPGTGFYSAGDYFKLIGKTSKKNIKINHQIKKNDI